jgi:hypothetical protein
VWLRIVWRLPAAVAGALPAPRVRLLASPAASQPAHPRRLPGCLPAGVEIEAPFGHDYNDLPCDQLNSRLFEQLAECLQAVQDTAADAV